MAVETEKQQDSSGVYIIAICPTCSATRYRSKAPIADAKECTPANFVGVDGAPEPQSEIPLCYVCNSVLVFSKETALKRRPDVAEVKPVYPERPVETLFEVRGDETIQNIYPSGDAVIILTNKRIVKVRVV